MVTDAPHAQPHSPCRAALPGGPSLPFALMIRSIFRSAVVGLVWAPMAMAQLPYLTAPAGTLRIELDGGFMPSLREYADGDSRRLGDPLASGGNLEADLAPRLTALLGRPASAASIGTLTANLMHQRGEGGIGLAVGVTRRITASIRVPIVSVRTESRLEHDEATATLGLNPALRGDGTSAAWLAQFGTALVELQSRRDAGEYAGNPTLQALANEVLASAPAWRTGIANLLIDEGQASLLLPLATSTDGVALLNQAITYRDQLSGPLGVTAPTGTPALPATGMTTEQFNSLLTEPDGFALGPLEEQPLVALGDVELGLVYSLAASSDAGGRRWFGAWLTGGVTLPTGAAPRADRLRDQGTGDRQLDARLGGTVELGRGRLGLRAEASMQLQFSGSREARIGTRDAFLQPASRTALLDWDPGDILTVSARPFFRIADRLAMTGSAAYVQKGEDHWTLPGDEPLPGSDLAAMGVGTDASALRVGVGLSYAHDGRHVDGAVRMPVEAGLTVERTVWSGSGLVAQQHVTKMWFRVYKRLW
jgi:hypothetical protein